MKEYSANRRWRRLPLFALSLSRLTLALTGYGGSSSSSTSKPVEHSGIFGGIPILELDYQQGDAAPRRTDNLDQFSYKGKESITFSIGSLELGSAVGTDRIIEDSIIAGMPSAEEQRLANILILLYTLDADGDLNKGIQITETIWPYFSKNADSLNPDLSPADFNSNLKQVIAHPDNTDAFSDTNPRERRLTTAANALKTYRRSTSPRRIVDVTGGKLSSFEADG